MHAALTSRLLRPVRPIKNRLHQHRSCLQMASAHGSRPESASSPQPEFTVLKEEQIYKRYFTLYNRRIRFPALKDRPVTILREFCQGPNQMMYGLPAGSFDAKRHGTFADCARAELWEEAQLEGGEWVDLLGPGHPGIAEVKWCANRFTPFLCIGPAAATSAGKQDAEEFIEIHRVDIARLREIMHSGNMLLPSVTTAFLALEELQRRGLL